MTRREIARELREAAKLINSGKEFACCYAIDAATGNDGIHETDAIWAFESMFRNDAKAIPGHGGCFWFRASDEGWEVYDEVRSRRILALLFCAELVERGDWE